MCSKFRLKANEDALRLLFALAIVLMTKEPDGDVAPSDEAPIVIGGAQGRKLVPARFGLIPTWSDGRLLINARGENVMTTPSFRDAFKSRRCLVPATAFYEWKEVAAGRKQPHRIDLAQGELFAFAGLWDERRGEDGEIERRFAIVTTEPNDLIKPIHDRMPVILKPEDYATWLDSGGEKKAAALLRPYPAEAMKAAPVERTPAPPKPNKQLGFDF